MRTSVPARLRRRSSTPASTEAGETLLEVMVAMMVLGISVVAILGAFIVATRTGTFNNQQSAADLVLRDFAETLKGRGPTTVGSASYDATYLPCETLGTGDGTGTNYPAYTPPAPNAGYQATITKIEYLNGYSGTSPVWRARDQGCPAGGDQGLERLTLRATTPASVTDNTAVETTTIVKRNTAGES
jgi:type II secretory pathway pseudopilin PulG